MLKNELFGKKNFTLMLIGVAVIFFGLILMGTDPDTDGDKFGFLGITVAPMVILIGFIIEFFAIMLKNPSNSASQDLTKGGE